MAAIVNEVKNLVNTKVIPNLGQFDQHNAYPTEIIEIMKSLGLFGLSIPNSYGGLDVDFQLQLQIIEILSVGSASLCSILDSHLRVCDSIINSGTDEQKMKYLPLLATGQLIAADGNSEKDSTTLENLTTSLTNVKDSSETWTLSGRKEWIINGRNSNLLAVSARIVSESSSDAKGSKSNVVVLVPKDTKGIVIANNLNGASLREIILAPVVFQDCLVKSKNIIGECLHDDKTNIDSSRTNSSLISSALSIGISKNLIGKCAEYLLNQKVNGHVHNPSEELVLRKKFGELTIRFEAAQSLYNDCCSHIDQINQSKVLACKIFTGEIAKEISLLCMELFADSGYVSESHVERYVRDALALTIIHSSKDISLVNIGQMVLNNFKLKEQHPLKSMVLQYAPEFLPHLREEFLLRASLKEQEKIIKAGRYRDVNLYIYDMTTLNASLTFKDPIGCLVFAHCLQNNIQCFCAQSSGSTAMAFIHYARKVPSVKLIQFYMTKNAYKIDPAVVPKNVTLVEVNSSETELRRLLRRFSQLTGIPIMANHQLLVDANKVRAYFLRDYIAQNGIHFDWYAQSISSGYGPIGLYEGFTQIKKEQQLLTPKFLGIQQEAVCPYARVLGYLDEDMQKNGEEVELLEPTLFRSDPSELMETMKNLLEKYGGKIKVLTNAAYGQYSDQTIELLAKNNIHIPRVKGQDILEKSGILALAATLHEINKGSNSAIVANENVLIGITGGIRSPAKERAKAHVLLDEHSTDEHLQSILQCLT